jgi:hypothetical protein
MRFTLQTHSTSGRTTPQIKILSSSEIITIPDGDQLINIVIEDQQSLVFDFFNKSQKDTIVDEQGKVIKDSEFKISKVWCDDILLESWFLTSAVYKPRYFEGYLRQAPDAPAEITAPFQFNFPGAVEWHWIGEFWDWYFNEKTNKEVIKFLDKDPDRVWKFRGSLDPCNDLVAKIKELSHI